MVEGSEVTVPTSRAQLRVLSVVGPGRSGTTLLGGVLGEVPGFFNAGEVRWLWERGVLGGRHCACGRVVQHCPVWGPTLELLSEQRSRSTEEDARDIVGWQRQLSALRRRPAVVRGRVRDPALMAAIECYTEVIAQTHRALGRVTGASTVIDTSKRAHDASIVERSPLEHLVIHIVRDPRAVAYSWTRVKPIPGAGGGLQMARRGPVRSTLRWTENCVGAVLLRRHVAPERWTFLRYEDFTASPRTSVETLLDFLDAPAAANPIEGDRGVRLAPNHTVAGNPNRHRSGLVPIREDVEWRTRGRRRDRLLVSALARPWMWAYGYDRGAS